MEGQPAEQLFPHFLHCFTFKWYGHKFFGTDNSWCSLASSQHHAVQTRVWHRSSPLRVCVLVKVTETWC